MSTRELSSLASAWEQIERVAARGAHPSDASKFDEMSNGFRSLQERFPTPRATRPGRATYGPNISIWK